MPILEIQRRMVQVGRIRMGTSTPRQDGGKTPKRLDTWRLTSRDRERLDAAQELYGGDVVPWDGHDGEFELITTTDALPIIVMPGQNLTSWYELWGQRTKRRNAPIECLRRCDGQTETISDGACLCDPENRECKPTTRLSVMLPEIPGIGVWRFDSHGYYAAVELAGTADLLEALTARGELVPARLRIDSRRVVRNGETKVFPVPVIDIDVRMRELLNPRALLAGPNGDEQAAAIAAPPTLGARALPPGGVSVEDALGAVERAREPKAQSARSAQPIGQPLVEPPSSPVPVEGDDDAAAPSSSPPAVAGAPAEPQPPKDDEDDDKKAPDAKPATVAQKKKLNVLVGQLRDTRDAIKTEHLYVAVARQRSIEVEAMIELTEGSRDEEGKLHWSPLRESLNRVEASALIERLQRLEEAA